MPVRHGCSRRAGRRARRAWVARAGERCQGTGTRLRRHWHTRMLSFGRRNLKPARPWPFLPARAFPTALTTVGKGVQFYDNVPFDQRAGVVYYRKPTDGSFDNFLPSLNLRDELDKDMIARFDAGRTLGRANYNLLGACYTAPNCLVSGCTVNGPNPNPEPVTANNIDASWPAISRAARWSP